MSYQRHNAFGDDHPGYHSEAAVATLFEEESKYKNEKYKNDGNSPFSAYRSNESGGENKEKQLSEFEKQIEENGKPKYEKKQEDEVIKKVADELNRETSNTPMIRSEGKGKSKNSIEDAIEKAIKQEKEILHL